MRAIAALCLVFLISLSSASAGGNFHEKRPCGPDAVPGPLRFFLFQGCAGADFRDACRAHDACYDTLGADQQACEDQFLVDLLTAAENSRRPKIARSRARFMYWLTSNFGKRAFDSAQEIAAEKAAASP